MKENTNCKKENIEADLNDKYWVDRFTYREEMVPIFLAKHKQKVLHAGKYLNVIRESGRLDVKNPYEDMASNEGFSFTKLVTSNDDEHDSSQAIGDVDMEDEEVKQIDTSGGR